MSEREERERNVRERDTDRHRQRETERNTHTRATCVRAHAHPSTDQMCEGSDIVQGREEGLKQRRARENFCKQWAGKQWR